MPEDDELLEQGNDDPLDDADEEEDELAKGD